jgi:dienelactone hydrolase
MALFDFFKKKPVEEPFTESTFECVRDGLTIRGTEYRPEGENLPVAIVCHGFMAWQDTVRHYTKELARMGYCAYCFDFCGGSVGSRGKSDGKTTEMSVLTEVRDLETVIAYAQSRSYNGRELLLMGASQGGFVSALTASKHPEMVSKLVLLYPALCIPDDARAGKMMFAKFDPNNIPDIVDCGPMKLGRCYVADVIGMDPYAQITGYTGPVLLLHGTKDRIVNVSYAHEAHKAYKEAGADISCKIIENGAHGFSKKHDAMAFRYLHSFAE